MCYKTLLDKLYVPPFSQILKLVYKAVDFRQLLLQLPEREARFPLWSAIGHSWRDIDDLVLRCVHGPATMDERVSFAS